MYKEGIVKYPNGCKDKEERHRYTARTIDIHLKAKSAESIKGEWIKRYCDYFKCSADYLFGFISLPTHEETDIEKEIGLSRNAIKQLHHLTTYSHGKVNLIIIDYFLRSAKFYLALTESINDYREKYECYEIGEEIRSKESQQVDNLTGGDIIKMFELYESGEFVSTISGDEIKKRKNDRDAAQYRVIKLFDNILEDLVKYFHNISNKGV